MKSCSNCVFWNRPLESSGGKRGSCAKLQFGSVSGVAEEEQPAITTDPTSVLTFPTFYCAMHETK